MEPWKVSVAVFPVTRRRDSTDVARVLVKQKDWEQ